MGRLSPAPGHHGCPHTAFTPDSCWPPMRTMMEKSCQRRARRRNSFHTEMEPAAFSAWSSCRISSTSSATSPQPRSLRSAEGGGSEWRASGRNVGGEDAGPPPPRASSTLSGSVFVPLLNQQVPRALGEEGQQEQLQCRGDPGQPQEDGPACKRAGGHRPTGSPARDAGSRRAEPLLGGYSAQG